MRGKEEEATPYDGREWRTHYWAGSVRAPFRKAATGAAEGP